jgi:hypothetical protein
VILDTARAVVDALLEFTSKLVVPDWGALVDLMPIFLLIGVVGPISSLLVSRWFIYFVRKPRLPRRVAETRRPRRWTRPATRLPAGEPYSPASG